MNLTVTHIHRGIDLQTDTMIRLDSLDAMITILIAGIEGDGESAPTGTIVKNYLFHLGQEVDLIRQNLDRISFLDISEQIANNLAKSAQEERNFR